MDKMIAWVHMYWWVCLLALTIAMKVLNAITKHYSEHRGLVRACLFVVDLLDIFKSTPAPKVQAK